MLGRPQTRLIAPRDPAAARKSGARKRRGAGVEVTQTLGRDLERRKVDVAEDHQDLLHLLTTGDGTEVGLGTGNEVREDPNPDHRGNIRRSVNIIIN